MFFGGVKPGKRNRGAVGKALVVIAVGQRVLKGYTLASMAVIPYVTAPILRGFLQDHVERGSDVFSDAFRTYPLAAGEDFIRGSSNVAASGVPAHVPLPGVRRVASLAKRWLLGTHQGPVAYMPPNTPVGQARRSRDHFKKQDAPSCMHAVQISPFGSTCLRWQ